MVLKRIGIISLIVICIIVLTIGLVIYFNKDLTYAKSIVTSAEITNNIMIKQKENEKKDKDVIVVALENNETQEKPKDTNVEKNENTVPNKEIYYIKVNYDAQVVTIYSKDGQGNYTVPIKAMVCSTGTHTPKSGVYTIPARWVWGALQGNVYGQYVTKITGNILFHSVPYLKYGDPSSLEYWEYDKLGTDASMGCVRLCVQDAKWIYENCANGTKVEFYSSPDPGPLGKPIPKKISEYPENLRNWDPTDSNPDNPWNHYKEPEMENK